LDIFTDESRQNQVHDFNLDVRPFPNGLFWTNFIPNSSVHVDGNHSEGGVRLEVNRLALFDYFSVNNALMDGNSIDATVSYNLRWANKGTPLTIDDGRNFHFQGRSTKATISWSASEEGFRFESSPAHTTKTNIAVIGSERNGVFYPAV
jgi:hypothetical protein